MGVICIVFLLQVIPVCLASTSVNVISQIERRNTDWNRFVERQEERFNEAQQRHARRSAARRENGGQRSAYERIRDQMDYYTISRPPPPYNPEYGANAEEDRMVPQPAPRNQGGRQQGGQADP